MTANGSNEIHVHVPLNVFYDLEDENPLDACNLEKVMLQCQFVKN